MIKIIVCMKQVPGTNKVALDPVTGNMMRDGARGKLNPFDLFAVEEALRLRELYGGQVTVLSMGPPQAESSLKEALYMGADEAYLVSDRALGGSDVLATSKALSEAVKAIGIPDLILCGKQTTDGDTAQVGPEMAEMLGIPHVSNATALADAGEGAMLVTTTLERSECTYRIRLPFLVSVEKDMNMPRLPSFRRMKALSSYRVNVLSLADLQDKDPKHYGTNGSATGVERVFAPEHNQERSFFQGTSREAAEAFCELLAKEKII